MIDHETDSLKQPDAEKPVVTSRTPDDRGTGSEPSTVPQGSVLVGVCTYNESSNIQGLLRSIRVALPDASILVIDDDSPDGTADLVRQFAAKDPNVEVLVRTKVRGLGSAIVAAIQYAIENKFDFFLNLDGDFSHDPARLPDLLAAAQSNASVDVVVGSRYVAGGDIRGWPLRRRWMSRVVNRFATTVLRLPVRDCSGSMRCYRVSTLAKLDVERLRCQGYALLEELLVRLHQINAKMIELPITFTDRQKGESKLTVGEAVRSITFMVRLALVSGNPKRNHG